ncbi:MarR family transcriptional regulator [Ruania suaedae]|uniref:MarR family winged helix-turn-helix transcriptional regulator n=1 Tax=Ruania suaedae TaxID=2897774 RepID=UPI001E491FF7|nr:MarR family transcriptional regulator [Ruania suaedae]UFU02923.1 MarR family transcriptional regulator [Ruania suaedae]
MADQGVSTDEGDVTASDPQWLNDAERDAWLALAGLLLRLPGTLDTQLERDAGLSFFEYMVLGMLAEQQGGELQMKKLAVLTNGSLSRLSHVVQRLERQGLVRRIPCPQDRRARHAVLTDEGQAHVQAAAPGHVGHARALVVDAVDSADLEAFGRVAATILDRVDAWQRG